MISSYNMVLCSSALQPKCCSKTKFRIEINAGLKPLNYVVNKHPASLNKTPDTHQIGNAR